MPYELNIPLQGTQTAWPGYAEQRGMHALFLAALQAADPALAQVVHDQPAKPFTQALLFNEAARQWQWRVTLLDDTLFDPFITGLSHLPEPHLRGRPLALEMDKRQTRHESYASLAQKEALPRYRFSFRTPTTFKQRTLHDPVPRPYLCYQSWWRRWNEFAPAELGINIALLDIVQAHLVVAHFNIRSQMWQNGKRRIVGGRGEMTFLALQPHKVADHWWQQAAVLAAFARFCGTGHKTTQGLGQTFLRE